MRNKSKKTLAITLAVILSFSLVACGGGASDNFSQSLKEESIYTNDAFFGAADMGYDYVSKGPETPMTEDGATTQDPLASRKIIYTADMTLETTEFDQAMEKLKGMVDKYGGYISRSNLYGYSSEYREQNFQIRIPAEHYQDFMSSAVSIGNIIRKNESVNDITAKYMDTEARLQVFRTEKARLEELMKKAETMEDILILDERISQVQSDIEGYEAQMRAMNDQVAMCTIDVTIEEVVIYTPTDTLFSTELLTAIKSGWTDFVELLQNIILGLAYNSFTLVFFGSIGFIGYKIHKKRQAKKGPKARKQHSALQEGDDIYNTPQQGDKK